MTEKLGAPLGIPWRAWVEQEVDFAKLLFDIARKKKEQNEKEVFRSPERE